MHGLLVKLLEKRGIRGVDDLKGEEKETFDQWNAILSRNPLLDPQDLKDFIEAQLAAIERKWRDTSLSDREKSNLVTQHTVYSALKGAVDQPRKEREATERYLRTLL